MAEEPDCEKFLPPGSAERQSTETSTSDSTLTGGSSDIQLDTVAFEDLFNLDDIQLLQDQFAQATGVASIITHTDGTPITKPSSFCRLCNDIIRMTEKGRANCYKSDAVIGRMSPSGPTIQPCMSGGLWDAGAAISIRGKHIANWLIGQVRDNTQTEERIRQYAREIGANEDEAARAFMDVPSMSGDRFYKISQMLFTIANQLSAIAYQNMRQIAYIGQIKQAQEALKEKEAYLRALIRTIPDLIWLKDLNGVFLFCNSRFEKLFAVAEKEIIGKTDYDFVDKDLADFFRLNDRLAALQGKPTKNEEELTFAEDGHHEIVETIKTPVYDTDGQLIGVLGIARDITERRHAENQLKETQELLQSFLDSATDAMMVWDASLNLKEINTAGISYFPDGTKKEHLIGKNIKEYVDDFGDKTILDKFNQVLESGKPVFSEELLTLEENNPRWFNVRLFKVGEGIGAIVNDVTEKRKLEEQLRQSQKIESIGRLAGGVAHDFNNMLGVIIGNTEMAMNNIDDEPALIHLREVQNAAKRSSELTRQLLAFARRQTIEPRVLDLNETLAGMLKMLHALIGEQVNLVWNPYHGLWPVKMDPSQVDQILTNLCVNARDAIGDTGSITIETMNVRLDEDFFSEKPERAPGDYVAIVVGDTGRGMEKGTVEKIFEPFFTTKAPGKGTGLGLSTVYGIVKQNRGFINVRSEPGTGTTFQIFFPRGILLKSDQKQKEIKGRTSLRGSETILILEDVPELLQMATRMLEKFGYSVIAMSSPAAAIHFAKDYGREIHLLITDVIMPGMNGRQLARHISAFYPKIKTIFMSGYTDNVIAHHGVLDEGVHFIPKPFTASSLATKVRDVLDMV